VSTQIVASTFEQLRERLARHGQAHVLAHCEELPASERAAFLRHLSDLDLDAITHMQRTSAALAAPGARSLEPAPVQALPETGGDVRCWREARERGEALLRAGRVAVFVVAGGQGTRLGHPGPKGTYRIGPVSRRSLFELQAQKIRGLRARSGRGLPWCVMTSPATTAATRRFFEEAGFFGLPATDVRFLEQQTVPSLDFEGRLLVDAPGRIVESPDGHGGSLTALLHSGCLEELEARGIDTIFYYQVDNPLVRIADPEFLGFHEAARADMSAKVIRKRDPMEKMGVVAHIGGRIGVVEYTEIDDAHRFAKDAEGRLVYWHGNIAVHVLRTGFVRRVAGEADRWLPYHASAKKVPHLDASGRRVDPREPNAHKFERFVFDALPAAERTCIVEARRGDEYSPVKNATGADSPETSRRDLVAQYRCWLADAGVEGVPDEGDLELDHSRIDGADDLRRDGIRHVRDAGSAIRIP
jgi:UDP-N-acetylglucosamine/UDP-N-acetylgalactosamine diphosphorylase